MNRTISRKPLVGTVSEAIGLIGQYQDAHSDRWNDLETRALFVSDVMRTLSKVVFGVRTLAWRAVFSGHAGNDCYGGRGSKHA